MSAPDLWYPDDAEPRRVGQLTGQPPGRLHNLPGYLDVAASTKTEIQNVPVRREATFLVKTNVCENLQILKREERKKIVPSSIFSSIWLSELFS